MALPRGAGDATQHDEKRTILMHDTGTVSQSAPAIFVTLGSDLQVSIELGWFK